MTKATRIHGLDALRAVLMLLGVLIHSALNYMPGWFVQDPHNQAEWMMIVIDVIHTFRMPAFFLLSGFFAALLVERRGLFRMFRNRFDRIVRPLAVFVLLHTWCSHLFEKHNSYINQGIEHPLWEATVALTWTDLVPWHTAHLWFLHQLFLITVLAVVAAYCLEKSSVTMRGKIPALFVTSVERPWLCLVCYSVLGSVWFTMLEWSDIPTDSSWFPNPILLAYYTAFYATGWILYTAHIDLSIFKRHCWSMLAVAAVAYVLRLVASLEIDGLESSVYEDPSPEVLFWYCLCALGANVTLVATTRGLVGLFLTYASSGSYFWRYVSDASYFVYIVHIVLTVLFTSLLIGLPVPTALKFAVVVICTGGYALLCYDAFVRSTFIGAFLNGRRYERFSDRFSVPAAVGLTVLLTGSAATLPLLAEPISPWNEGKLPTELTTDSTLQYPYVSTSEKFSGMFSSCAKIQGVVICPVSMSFEEARNICNSEGMHLLRLDSQAKQERISPLIWSLKRGEFWLDLSDRRQEGAFVWGAESPLEFEFWSPGEPNNWGGDEDCAVFNFTEEGHWNDTGCSARANVVCASE